MIVALCLGVWLAGAAPAEEAETMQLTARRASLFARLALKGLTREYPNKPAEVLNGDRDVLPPRQVHPAFYGCFDWHSAVHGHWMLVRLLRVAPDLPEAKEIRHPGETSDRQEPSGRGRQLQPAQRRLL